MPYPQYYDIAAFNINYNSIITDPKTMRPQLRIRQPLGMRQRILLIPEKSFADSLLVVCIELLDIFHRSSGIDKLILHLPKTSLCIFTRPAL